DAVVAVGVGDRAALAQVVPDGERVGRPGVVGVVEVGGPVGDRLVATHQAPSSSISTASSGQLAAASRACSSSSGGTVPSPITTLLPRSSGSKTIGARA